MYKYAKKTRLVVAGHNDQSSIFKGVYKNFTYILHIKFLLRFFPKIKFLLNLCSQKLTFRPIDKCANKVYNQHVLKREQRKGFNTMQQFLRLGQDDYLAIENVKKLLSTLAQLMKSSNDTEIVNLDTMKPLDYDSLTLALRYLKRNFD